MSQKIITTVKHCGLLLTLFFSIISCEQDLEDIAVDLVGNRFFSVGDSLIEIVTYTINTDSSRVDNNNSQRIPLNLIGVNKDANFGHMKSTLISQVLMTTIGGNFGDNPIIDLVVLDIPYFATRNEEDQDAVDPITGEILEDDDGNPIPVPNFQLDSVYGNKTQEFNVQINELGTFLNVLDPENPTNNKAYYSDKVYELKDEIFSGDFKLNRNDTVLYVERRYLDDDPNTVDDIDTIKAQTTNPSMKFFLNEEFFKNRFLEHDNPNDFANNSNFIHYFRGLYIDSNGADGALINVAAANAKMSIYYTNEEIIDGVTVKTKRVMHYAFLSGVRTGKYQRDYSGYPIENALVNPDKINGEEKIYVQGAAGVETIIDLFTEENLEKLRNENWLINEANITIYLDDNQNDEVPNNLFLYNYDDISTLKDFRIDGPDSYGGRLEYDDDGNPYRYKFRITRYISDILNLEEPRKLSRLAIKNYLTTDLPTIPLLDTIVKDYNWISKGVVLKGNLPKVNDKRINLEIFYSKSK